MDNLLNIDRLKKYQAESLVSLATSIKSNFPLIKKEKPLVNKNIIFLFLEPSTRTKTSFKFSSFILGANIIDISPASSSITKGETFEDTLKTLSAYPADALILRSYENSHIEMAEKMLDFPVINAGLGTLSHPTQALTDLMTLKEKGIDMKNTKISIVGDIAHSRVARSSIEIFTLFEAKINLCAPNYFKHKNFSDIPYYEDLDDALKGADILMTLRIQKERLNGLSVDIEDYSRKYMITKDIMDKYKIKYVMHPGPVNEGIEISKGLQDSKRSLIHEQVKNGTWIRCAVLSEILAGKKI